MREKRRKGRVTTKTSVEDEIVHLRGLDLRGLRARWHSVLQKPAPDHLPRHLLFAIIAYRIQADLFGDLDHETRQLLDRTDARESGAAMSARLVSFDQKRTELTPGTVLVREWVRQSQRVMMMSDGFAWNGQQLSMDPRRSPRRISNAHLADKLTYLRGYSRPPRRLDFQRQYALRPARCQRMIVSGLTIANAH